MGFFYLGFSIHDLTHGGSCGAKAGISILDPEGAWRRVSAICQLVIDVARELSARRGDRFEDYTQAVRNLVRDERFPPVLVRELERLPGFRNVLVHEYVPLDMARVVEALDRLQPLQEFADIVGRMVAERNPA